MNSLNSALSAQLNFSYCYKCSISICQERTSPSGLGGGNNYICLNWWVNTENLPLSFASVIEEC